MKLLFVFSLLITVVIALGPPKLISQPPDEVWFEPNGNEEYSEAKLTLKCEATGNPEV